MTKDYLRVARILRIRLAHADWIDMSDSRVPDRPVAAMKYLHPRIRRIRALQVALAVMLMIWVGIAVWLGAVMVGILSEVPDFDVEKRSDMDLVFIVFLLVVAAGVGAAGLGYWWLQCRRRKLEDSARAALAAADVAGAKSGIVDGSSEPMRRPNPVQ